MGLSFMLFKVVGILFDAYMGALLLRVLFQLARADFYNPLSQLVWKLTNPPVQPLRVVVPKYRNIDTAALTVLLVIAIVFVAFIDWQFNLGVSLVGHLWFAMLKCLLLTSQIYFYSLFIQAILSWFGPGMNNPAANVLQSLNEPLLKPVRRFIPTLSGFDFSPMAVMFALYVLGGLLPLPVYFR